MIRSREIMTPVASTQPRPRIVIIGAGFGGLSVAKQLAQAPFEVTIVDRHNYRLFQPLLYQVATAGLSPGTSPPRFAQFSVTRRMPGSFSPKFRVSIP